MRKYAIINNNTVTEIVNIELEQYSEYSSVNQMVIDIEDVTPAPYVGYVLNGNTLQIPCGTGDREEYEYNLAVKKTDFGIKLSRVSIDQIGARNKVLEKTGTQVLTLLNSLIGIKLLLETGALGTARYSCTQLKLVYTEYSDIFDHVIEQINSFEISNGL